MLAFIPQCVKATCTVYFTRIIRKALSLIRLYVLGGTGASFGILATVPSVIALNREGPRYKVIPKYTVCAVLTASNGW